MGEDDGSNQITGDGLQKPGGANRVADVSQVTFKLHEPDILDVLASLDFKLSVNESVHYAASPLGKCQ